MILGIRKLLGIILILTISYNITAYSQDDWQLIDESAVRLPDTISLSETVACGDINNDGAIDLLVGQFPNIPYNLPGNAQLYLNSGQGYFNLADSSYFPQRNDETSVNLLFDMDSDGDLDAFITNYNFKTDYVAINDGSGIFHIDWARLPLDSSVSLEGDFADIEEDGDIDVCLLGNIIAPRSHRLWVNNGSGYFNDEIYRLPVQDTLFRCIKFADIDGDLDPDIMAIYLYINYSRYRLFINDGTGNFLDESSSRLPVSVAYSPTATFSDIDNDGDFDVVISFAYRLGFYINDGTGHFTEESEQRGPLFPVGNGLPFDIRATDFDNDGDDDLILGTINDHPDFLFINDGTGHFSDQTELRLPNQSGDTRSISVGDFDGDGDEDAFRVGAGICKNTIFINTLNLPDSIPPYLINQYLFPIIDTLRGPYSFRLIAKDGIASPYELSCYIHYSTNGTSFNSDSMHFTGAYTYYGIIPEVDSGETVYYYYSITDKWQNTSNSPSNAPDSVFSFTYLPGYTAIEASDEQMPNDFSLSAYPNPFNSATTFTLTGAERAEIGIYDIAGRLITALHTVGGQAVWDASAYSSGLYFARVAGEKSSTINLMLLK
jgi:hypothetical protein